MTSRKPPVDLGAALRHAWLVNARITEVLLDLLDPRIWRAFPASSPRRNIATSFAHVHNVRLMRLKMSGKGIALPERLYRSEVTAAQAKRALAASARAFAEMIDRSVATGGNVPGCVDVVNMVMLATTHEAHHRGQICHWARELGAPLTLEQQLRLWAWDKRWKEAGGD